MANKPLDDDAEEWKNTPARELPPKKIPLDAAHECPMCSGKGFVRIVKTPSRRRRKEDLNDAC